MGLMTGNFLAIDLGSSNTSIFLGGEGVVLREPTAVLALRADPEGVIAIGHEAKAMLGRSSGEAVLVSPVMDGAVTDVDMAALLTLALCEKVTGRRKSLEKMQLYMSMSQGLTKVEKDALTQVAKLTGARSPLLVRTPLAAALGSGLTVDTPRGSMIVVLGGGTTEIAVLSMGGVVAARSMRTGSLSFYEAIVRFVRRRKNVLIGLRTAEDLKCDIASALLPDYDVDTDDPEDLEPFERSEFQNLEATEDSGALALRFPTDVVAPGEMVGETVLLKGRDCKTGKPVTVPITTRELALSLREPIRTLVDALRDAIGRVPAELAADIAEDGIRLSGGGALMLGLAELLSNKLELNVSVDEHPQDDVALGMGRLFEDEQLLKLATEAGSVEG
jgi:rod shape-determining protein MreB and related proteins